jgi:hypothetical protein
MEAWLEERGLSSKQLAAQSQKQDLHLVLGAGIQGAGGRRVLRCVASESLRAYRMLPSFMRVRICDVSPPFTAANGRTCLYLEYDDASPVEGENALRAFCEPVVSLLTSCCEQRSGRRWS